MKIPHIALTLLSRSGTLFTPPIACCPQVVPLLMALSPYVFLTITALSLKEKCGTLGKKGKRRSFLRLLDDEPCVFPYPYHYGLVELEIPHPRILEATSSTNLSTIPIH